MDGVVLLFPFAPVVFLGWVPWLSLLKGPLLSLALCVPFVPVCCCCPQGAAAQVPCACVLAWLGVFVGGVFPVCHSGYWLVAAVSVSFSYVCPCTGPSPVVVWLCVGLVVPFVVSFGCHGFMSCFIIPAPLSRVIFLIMLCCLVGCVSSFSWVCSLLLTCSICPFVSTFC